MKGVELKISPIVRVEARRGLALMLGLCVIISCATLKGVLRTVNDIATDLCLLTASEQLKRDGKALDGLTIAQWCDIKENLDPFINEVLKAQKLAAGQAGLAEPPQ